MHRVTLTLKVNLTLTLSSGTMWSKISNGWCRRGAPFANLVLILTPSLILTLILTPILTLNPTGARAGRLS